jgi:hypothetical protein
LKYYREYRTLKSQIVVDKISLKIICVHVVKRRKHDFRLFKKRKLPILQTTKIQAILAIKVLRRNMLIVKCLIKEKKEATDRRTINRKSTTIIYQS